jgi:hypothetical protein
MQPKQTRSNPRCTKQRRTQRTNSAKNQVVVTRGQAASHLARSGVDSCARHLTMTIAAARPLPKEWYTGDGPLLRREENRMLPKRCSQQVGEARLQGFTPLENPYPGADG